MLARWWTLVVWALVAAGGLFWGLRLLVSAPPLPVNTPVAALGTAARGDLSRLLGPDTPPAAVAAAAEPPPDARFQLIGLLAPRSPAAAREGLALIAVDGKPAKAFRVGAVIDGPTVLKSVAARSAMLGPRDGAAQMTLSLAPPAPAATGSLATLGARAEPSPETAAPAVDIGRRRARESALRGVPPPAAPSADPAPRGQPRMPTD
jgi:general secretion pathway protein C